MSVARKVYSVAEVLGRARRLVEQDLGLFWLEAEISNFAAPASGHWYFSLKDSEAQVRCAMFRNRNQLVSARPRDGDRVLVRARLTVYEPRGDLQLSVEYLEPAGFGALQQQFERLKAKLAAEGLFAAERKRPLPVLPARIGVITSPTGAAVHDVLSVLARRAPQLEVIIYPAVVQGNEAPASLMAALAAANRRRDCDVLLLTRGGGSLEDLFCFNDEALARAIADSDLPVVSAVGHEVDFTIADFVADLRAPTPSAAAGLIAPDRSTTLAAVRQSAIRLEQALHRQLERRRALLQQMQRRLPTPRRLLEQRAQRLDDLQARLRQGLLLTLHRSQAQLTAVSARFARQSPAAQVARAGQRIDQLKAALQRQSERLTSLRRQRLQALAATLQAVSPLATLARGYTLTRTGDGQLLRADSAPLPTGSALDTQLAGGRRIRSRVETDSGSGA